MTRSFSALYENGVFRPLKKIRLKNKQTVKLTLVENGKSLKLTRKGMAKRRRLSRPVGCAAQRSHGLVGLFKSGVRDLAKRHDGYLYR